jgi:hypothetical protein
MIKVTKDPNYIPSSASKAPESANDEDAWAPDTPENDFVADKLE